MGCCRFFHNPNRGSHSIHLSANAPATRLFEKSQEYTAFYTEAYKAKARSIQLTYAAVGFAISAGIGILIFLGGLAMIGSISNNMPY